MCMNIKTEEYFNFKTFGMLLDNITPEYFYALIKLYQIE